MVRRDGAAIRKERIHEATQYVKNKLKKSESGAISFSETLAELEYDLGLTSLKLKSYLKLAEKLGFFLIDEDENKIKTNES